MGKILLYYKYVDIQYPKQIVKWQQDICKQLGLTGRILIATEGINGTVGGTDEATAEYKRLMLEHPLFSDVDFKESAGGAEYFPRLRIVERDEIVTLRLDKNAVCPADTGIHLKPAEAHELMNQAPEDLVILDTRNTYETCIGTFRNAIIPDIENFRDFPEYVDKHLDLFKDKQVLMFCTGGVRCERATAYMKLKDIAKKVYQIEGGIVRYAEQFPEGHFRGKNYVFDNRIAVRVNDDILGTCLLCNKPCDDYVNCLNTLCNKHFIACDPCIDEFATTCNARCKELVTNNLVAIRTKLRPMLTPEETQPQELS